jgi:hypothetical protein
VLSSAQNAVLPKTGCCLLRNLSPGFLLLAAIFLLAKPLHPADTPSLDDALRQLADRIASMPALKGPLRLEVHNDPAFDSSQGSSWTSSLRRELARRNLAITEESTAPLLRVGATETPVQIILAADIVFADHQETRIVALKRAALLPQPLSASPLRIEKQLLFESPERILDAALPANSSVGALVVLSYHDAELMALRLDPAGSVKQTVPISAAAMHASREPRAELTIAESDVQLQLGGKLCEFTWAAPSDVKCHPAKTTWRPSPSLASPCDSTAWKLQADANDWTAADLVQLLPEAASRQGSAPLLSDFPGPILSLNSTQNAQSALVVIRNLRTGNYEVYNLTLACGN